MFIHYNITPKEKLVEFVRGYLEKATWVRCDWLDGKHMARQATDKTPEDILAMIPTAWFIHCAGREGELCVNVNNYFIWIRPWHPERSKPLLETL